MKARSMMRRRSFLRGVMTASAALAVGGLATIEETLGVNPSSKELPPLDPGTPAWEMSVWSAEDPIEWSPFSRESSTLIVTNTSHEPATFCTSFQSGRHL